MEHAEAEDNQEFNISRYSDDLLLCLAKEKRLCGGDVGPCGQFGHSPSTSRGGNAEEEGGIRSGGHRGRKFEDAKETGSITSNTSKTQRAAEDSQAGTAMSAFPQPPEGEGGHQVHAAVGHGDG